MIKSSAMGAMSSSYLKGMDAQEAQRAGFRENLSTRKNPTWKESITVSLGIAANPIIRRIRGSSCFLRIKQCTRQGRW